MCTVTIIPQGENDFVLTSNRDEAPNRSPLPPEFYTINNTKMLFPKDVLSGGTWIGVSDKNRLVCVLNGGFTYHERKASYRMSRGIVAKDLLISEKMDALVKGYNFQDIEPFTMVIVDWNVTLKLYELVWDGSQKHSTEVPLEPKIWSSSTLYSEDMKQQRLRWFEDFISDSYRNENELNSESLLNFHNTAGQGNDDYGVIMDRHFVKTTSITQVEKNNDAISMRFNDLQSNTSTTKKFKHPLTVDE